MVFSAVSALTQLAANAPKAAAPVVDRWLPETTQWVFLTILTHSVLCAS